MFSSGRPTSVMGDTSGVNVRLGSSNRTVVWDYTSLMGKSLQGRFAILTLTFDGACAPAWGLPVFLGTEHLSFMIQQRRALFPALRLGTGWSLEGCTSQ
jgi:hypothetical protein